MYSKSRWITTAFVVLSLSATLIAQQPTKKKKSGARPKAVPVQQEVKDLRELVTTQQQQLEIQRQQMDEIKGQLQQLIDATQQTHESAKKAETGLTEAQAAAAKAQQDATEAQRLADQAGANAVEAKTSLALVNTKSEADMKRVSALEGIAGRFRFNGDVRVRGESFFQDCAACLDRNRARLRAR